LSLEGVPPKKVKSVALHWFRGEIDFRMGSTYQDVVRTCITGDFDERGTTKNWQEVAFLKKVVHQLELCRV
jgi:hypothetical protein